MKDNSTAVPGDGMTRRRRALVRSVSLAWRFCPPYLRYFAIWLLNPKVIIGVSGVVLNEVDQILLLRHRFHPDFPWGLPGGLLKRGEGLAQGWKREVREETGLEIEPIGIVDQRSMWASQEFILVGRLCGGVLELDPVEILEARFFEADELPRELRRYQGHAIRRVLERQIVLPIL